MRLVFIADKSEAYTTFERDRVLDEWSVAREETRAVESLDEVGHSSLFGPAPVSLLLLSDKDQVRLVAENLKKADQATLDRIFNPGLIIYTNVDRTSTKTIEKTIVELGGQIILAKGSSKETPTSKLVDDLSVSNEAKQFLKDYAGDDYGSILGLVKTVSALSKRQQQAITIQDLIVRMPTPPGAIPPWEIEPAILSGNITKAIELYRRVSETSHLLIVMAILKNKFRLVYKVSSLLQENPRHTTASISKTLSPAPANPKATKEEKARISKASTPDNYPLKLALTSAKKLGYQRASKIAEIVAETERKIKGGAAGDPHIHMERMIIEISLLASSNTHTL